MSTPRWKPGTLYLPGDLVQPITALPPTTAQVANGGFESGATGWDFTGGVVYKATDGYGGGACCEIPGSQPNGDALNQTELLVEPGKSLTARCMIRQGASDVDHTRGWVIIRWFDNTDTQIGVDATGNIVNDGRDGAWHQSTVTAVAPANTAYARAGIGLYQNSNDEVRGDSLSVTGAYAGAPPGLIYKAVQDGPGTSDSTEPTWPAILGQQVIDNTVIWEAVLASRVTWEASPILKSGTTEPEWPTQVGGFVPDGTINWECVSRRVEDENCPNTKVVIIMASKVFAVDDDIIRFCATANPLDWTTERDAGYLPSGLQSANANDMAVLGQYRGNLVAFNASSFQNWQVDPDPAAMAILDQMEGIGSTWNKAAQAVGNELLFLSQRGVRSVGIAAGAENLSAGDVGEPIDVLVQDAVRVAVANGTEFRSTYYPGAGQYWLAVADYPPSAPTISGDLPDGYVGDTGTMQYVVSGGVKPYGPITVLTGSLPPGATMDADGLVTYEYTTEGDYAWTVGGVDADGAPFSVADTADVIVIPWIAIIAGSDLLFSPDGIDWSDPDVPSPAPSQWQVIGASGNNVLMHSRSGGKAAYSNDGGATWIVSTLATAPAGSKGNLMFAGGYWFVPAAPAALNRSTDGVTWSNPVAAPASSGHSIAEVTIDGITTLVMVDENSNFCRRSTDYGDSWANGGSIHPGSGGTGNSKQIASNGSMLVVGGDRVGAWLAYSTDAGVTWTACTRPTGATVTCVTHGEGVWLAGLSNGAMWRSTDGITFTDTGFSGTTVALVQVAYAAGRFLAVWSSGLSTSGYMAGSPDGLVWTQIIPSSGTQIFHGIVPKD